MTPSNEWIRPLVLLCFCLAAQQVSAQTSLNPTSSASFTLLGQVSQLPGVSSSTVGTGSAASPGTSSSSAASPVSWPLGVFLAAGSGSQSFAIRLDSQILSLVVQLISSLFGNNSSLFGNNSSLFGNNSNLYGFVQNVQGQSTANLSQEPIGFFGQVLLSGQNSSIVPQSTSSNIQTLSTGNSEPLVVRSFFVVRSPVSSVKTTGVAMSPVSVKTSIAATTPIVVLSPCYGKIPVPGHRSFPAIRICVRR